MATYLLWSGGDGTSGTEAGGWAAAYQTYTAALAGATADGDIIKVHKGHTEELGADTTYTYGAHISVICVDKDNSDALSTMGTAAWIGNSTTNRGIVLAGAKKVYHYGITFRVSGATADVIGLCGTNGAHQVFESCYLWIGNSNASSDIVAGNSVDSLTLTEFTNTTLRFGTSSRSCTSRLPAAGSIA